MFAFILARCANSIFPMLSNLFSRKKALKCIQIKSNIAEMRSDYLQQWKFSPKIQIYVTNAIILYSIYKFDDDNDNNDDMRFIIDGGCLVASLLRSIQWT